MAPAPQDLTPKEAPDEHARRLGAAPAAGLAVGAGTREGPADELAWEDAVMWEAGTWEGPMGSPWDRAMGVAGVLKPWKALRGQR